MPKKKQPWFVTERSAILAKLLFTSRAGVRIRQQQEQEGGADLLVEVETGGSFSTRMFVAQVRGVASSDPKVCRRAVEGLFPGDGDAIQWPTCVLVVDVRDNRFFFSWLAEPVIEDERPTLRFPDRPELETFDESGVGPVVDRIKAWYAALAQVLQPA